MYGPTETTVWSTACEIKHSNPPILVGKPIDNTQLYILDEAQQPVPPGRVGELWIGGHGLATGYVNLAELTAERFVYVPSAGGQRLYRSGDLARWTPDGEVQCLGRADGQVKLRGYRIETGDVEAALMRHPSVAKCAVVLAGDGQDAFLAAFVVTEEGADFGAAGMRGTLREHVHSLLPAYMAPAEYVRLPELPLTPNAKVDHKALRAQAAVRSAASEERAWTPTDPLEAQVAEIWERYLHKPVQPEDDFFDLGGHSLMAVNLLETIASVTGIRLRLDVLFKAPTVRSMSAAMRSVRVDVPARCLVPIHPEGDLAPMFFVHGMGGGLLDARALAACVHPNRPFYGLQSAGMDPNVAPVETVEQMAKEYLSEVLAAAPFGPITLVGHCTIGGVIAYEMARQMLAMGRPEPTLIMIDTEYRTGSYWSPDDDISHSKIYQVFRIADYHWARFARQSGLFAKCKYGWNVVAEAVQSRIRPNALAGVPHLQKLHETNLAAIRKYQCPEYAGMVHHIVSTGASTVGYLHRRLSWSEATTVDCRFVRGEHSDLLLGNSAGTIAEMIEAIILRVEKKATGRRTL
jgi:thioesterase domain-containing protein/acyl carrier protein